MSGMSQDSTAALREAMALHRTGRSDEAERAFLTILAAAPQCFEAMHGLSLVCIQQDRRGDARAWIERALAIVPRHPGLHYTLGVMALEDGDTACAMQAFSQATTLKPDFLQAWNNLGLALGDLGRADEAAEAFQAALRINPDYDAALRNLGNLAFSRGAWGTAAACLRRLFALTPRALAVCRQLARTLIELREWAEARDVLQDLAEEVLHDEEMAHLLAHACCEMNDAASARRYLAQRADFAPGDLRARLGAELTVPRIHASTASIVESRVRFEQGLHRLLADTDGATFDAASRTTAAQWSNFYLGYQGEDDRDLQIRYGTLLGQLLAPAMPVLQQPAATRSGGRIRVGFASCFFRDCTVGHYFRSWITDLDPARFEVSVLVLGGAEDSVSDELRAHAAHYRRIDAPLPEAAQSIVAAGLDILVYPELGMNGRTFALASQRLAPVQCVAWGHPVTTGLPSIDVFLSSALMEPEDGACHYSEHLLLLPGLGTRYRRPEVATTLTRRDLGLPEGKHLYFYPHALFKIHPEDDIAVTRILAEDPDGILVVCVDQNRWITEAYLSRLHATLQAHGVQENRVHRLPYLPRPVYLQANRLCDMMLDTCRWSGGNTSLDALAAGLPIISRRGRFMRARQSAGLLDAIGLGELIAQDENAFVSAALNLAHDDARRTALRRRIIQSVEQIFDDARPIRALEEHLVALHEAANRQEHSQ